MYVMINTIICSMNMYIFVQKRKIENLDVCKVTNVLMACQNYMKDKDVSHFY